MNDTARRKRDDDALAGEYVLGVLSAEQRRTVEQRIGADRTFAERVEHWQQRLAPLDEEVSAITPPARAWRRIERALFAGQSARQGLWNNLAVWRWLSAALGAVAVAGLAALVVLTPPQRPVTLVAALQASDTGPAFLATMDRARGILVIRAVAAKPDPGRVPELWLIPADGTPRSLGLIEMAGATSIELPPALSGLARAEAGLAISLEPAGGSPTGKPTGPVIAVGKLQQI